jgi:hypothetical protein
MLCLGSRLAAVPLRPLALLRALLLWALLLRAHRAYLRAALPAASLALASAPAASRAAAMPALPSTAELMRGLSPSLGLQLLASAPQRSSSCTEASRASELLPELLPSAPLLSTSACRAVRGRAAQKREQQKALSRAELLRSRLPT